MVCVVMRTLDKSNLEDYGVSRAVLQKKYKASHK